MTPSRVYPPRPARAVPPNGLIVAVHDGHNASACLLDRGHLRMALQEERLSRVKNDSDFPSRAVQRMLSACDVAAADVGAFIFSSRHMPWNKSREALVEEYRQSSSASTRARRALKHTPLYPWVQHRRRQQRRARAVALGFDPSTHQVFDHHLSHASTAYFGCPWWREEPVLVLTNDAGGDDLCATVSIGRNGTLQRLAAVPVSESLGYVYSMVTCLLGMVPEEHEYKLMGMAPYSDRDKHAPLRDRFRALFEFSGEGGLAWRRRPGCPATQYSYTFFRRLLERERFDQVCGGLQAFCEDMLVEWVRHAIAATGIHKLALGGGVFMNVKANQRLMQMPEVEGIFVAPSCGDESNCLGAAFAAYHRQREACPELPALEPLGSVTLGPSYDGAAIAAALATSGHAHRRMADIERETAGLLARGEIVARFNGPMEFGARALGNRSILANPSRLDSVRVINAMIKCRDFWMPFAASLLPERANDYLVNPKGVAAPYMIMCFDTVPGRRADLAAASHPYDHTVRPQIVNPAWSPGYTRLLRHFEALTGIGGVLNTSFNLHGFPVVCSPEEALAVFRDSGLRHLAIGDFLVSKDALPTGDTL